MNLATRTSLALVGALLLAGCSGGDAPDGAVSAPTAPVSSAAPTPTDGAPESTAAATETRDDADGDAPGAGGSAATCTGVPTGPREIAAGDALGECIVTAMVAAGSGKMTVVADDGEPPTEVEFEYTPELAIVNRAPALTFVVVDDTAWMNIEGQWHREGDGAMGDLLADGLGVLRAFSDPRASAAVIGACPEWESSGLITHADAGNAIAYECTAPFDAMGVTMSSYRIVVDPDFLGIETVATGTFMGFTTTTTQTFRDWGEPVEIPRPEVD
ncbi:hypothetical protein GCM10011331_11460 [Flavimobilis marinus]|nr:hypothetical protein [Flavimobilis marinus]GHG49161.1 hypothetical protein GCM10011331_11460 [Flavimobilis marinus]